MKNLGTDMPAILTIITEENLLDFASGEIDPETREAVRAAAETDCRVKRLLASLERVSLVLGNPPEVAKAP